MKPNYHEQNAQSQPCYLNYQQQQQRSDFVDSNQIAHTNYGYSSNNKFLIQNNDQFESYQKLQLCNENIDFRNQYQTQDFYEAQSNTQQIGQYQQDKYNHQNLNSKLVQNKTGLFTMLTNRKLINLLKDIFHTLYILTDATSKNEYMIPTTVNNYNKVNTYMFDCLLTFNK